MAKAKTIRLSQRARLVLQKAGMFISSDEALVRYMDDLTAIMADAKSQLDEAGIIVDISNPENPETKQEQRHPAINILLESMKMLIQLMNALGLTGAKRVDILRTFEDTVKAKQVRLKRTEADDMNQIAM